MIEILKRLLGLLEHDSEDEVLIQCLWSSALIAYARCFSSGKRLGLKRDLYKKYEGALDCHDFYINLRNKHIAKWKTRSPSFSVLSRKLIAFDIEGVRTFLKIASIAHREVVKSCRESEAKALEVGKSLPIDELYSIARSRLVIPGPEDTQKARK